jgi:hypothetical protein
MYLLDHSGASYLSNDKPNHLLQLPFSATLDEPSVKPDPDGTPPPG